MVLSKLALTSHRICDVILRVIKRENALKRLPGLPSQPFAYLKPFLCISAPHTPILFTDRFEYPADPVSKKLKRIKSAILKR